MGGGSEKPVVGSKKGGPAKSKRIFRCQRILREAPISRVPMHGCPRPPAVDRLRAIRCGSQSCRAARRARTARRGTRRRFPTCDVTTTPLAKKKEGPLCCSLLRGAPTSRPALPTEPFRPIQSYHPRPLGQVLPVVAMVITKQ